MLMPMEYHSPQKKYKTPLSLCCHGCESSVIVGCLQDNSGERIIISCIGYFDGMSIKYPMLLIKIEMHEGDRL